MAEIAVIEKAPGYRLDHPDFGVVCRVTFAKGIIKEINKLQDGPIQMAAQAKVTVEGSGESDFIPIFYCPKAQYWGTDDHQAQDINQAGKYYENAWMSFRGDDEAKVMLVESKPFAVIGFLDGVPRVGEDIIKVAFETYAAAAHALHLQCSKNGQMYGDLDGASNGPDGNDLGLELEAVLLCHASKDEEGLLGCYDETGHPIGCDEAAYTITHHHMYDYYEWLIKVGPIMYIFQGWSDNSVDYIEKIKGGSPYETGWTNWVRYTAAFSVLSAPYSKALYNQMISEGAGNSGSDPEDIDNNWHSVGGRGYWLAHSGFTYQDDFTVNLMNNINLNPWSYDEDALDPSTFVIKSRPHTKEELQVAGMWPNEG